MKILILDTIHRHLNPNPYIFPAVCEAFERIASPDHVIAATRCDLEAAVAVHCPDVIVAFSCQIMEDFVPVLCAVRERLNAVVGWWITDDPYEIDVNLERARLFDFVATNDHGSLSLYWGTSVLHVPLGADRDRHFCPVRPHDAEYEWDIVFCGVPFPNRRALIEAAAPVLSRYKTRIIGAFEKIITWASPQSFVVNQRLDNSAFVEFCNSARIVLNLPRHWNLNNLRDFPASTPAPRTFEVAAAGGFQLVVADRPEFHQFFDIPEEMDLFFTAEDLATKIEWYLTHSQERIAAAQKAQNRTLQHHLYDHRAMQILEHVADLKAKRTMPNKLAVLKAA